MDTPQPPLDLQWVFGVSSDTRGGVVDLRTDTNTSIAYAAGHIIVIYDPSQHRQMFLQGHVHQVQCLSACPKKRFIVSADCGPDAVLIVWNSTNGQVHSSIPQKETGGIVAIDFWKEGDSFATLSATGRNRMQTLCIWNIGSTSCKLTASLSMFVTDRQHCLRINTDDQDELVTNGKDSVFFWTCFKVGEYGVSLTPEEQSNKSVDIVLKREQAMAKHVEMQKSMCELTLSSFVPSSDSAITGMISGEVIFWQEPRSPFFKEPSKLFSSAIENKNCEKEPSARRMHAVKIVQLHHSAITHLSVQDNYVVTGGSDGYVRFYDCRLGLVGWFEELQAGEITSLSFSAMNDYKQESTGLTLQVPPFVVGTKKGHVVFLHCAISEEQPGSLLNKGQEMMDYVPKMVKCVSAHPRLPHFAIINADGLFQVHDYDARGICSEREFFKLKAEVIVYSPSGSAIACGFFNGILKIVDSNTLQDMENIAISRSGITKLEFANDETLLAVADASFAVSLVSCSISEDHQEDKWEYVGKFRSHARTIVGLHFTKDDDGNNRLFSVGQDSMIVEYDLPESLKEKRLKLRGTWPLNAAGLPMALFSTTAFKTGELHLLISDSSFKIRVYDTKNFACHKTFLGPTFGSPVNSMFRISLENSLQDYLAFGTEDQILGVMVLPLEKNKNVQYVGVIGHAGCIQHMTISHDCKFLITVAAHDGPSEKAISLNDFLPIFLNHKPVMDIDALVVQHAFNALGSDPGSGRLNLEFLLAILQSEGERMTREEIQECMEKILNKHANLDALPREINAAWFCNKILKL